MEHPPRSTSSRSVPSKSTINSDLKTVLHSLVPPYFLKWGPNIGVVYGLASLTGFLCHVMLMAFVITFAISKTLNWLLDAADLPATLSAIVTNVAAGLDRLSDPTALPAWVFIPVISWWLVTYIWMAAMYKLHHDGTHGWRAYICGGGWAWRFHDTY